MDRATWRANKIRLRLSGSVSSAWSFPPRPKGMWQRTYETLRDLAMAADMEADEMFGDYLARDAAVQDRRTMEARQRSRRRRKAALMGA